MAHDRLLMIVTCTGVALSWLGSARADTTPILIELSVDAALVNEAALSQAISQELDCPVVSNRDVNHAGEVTIRTLARGQVSVTFKATDNQAPLVRVVALPNVPEQRAQWIAWLVGNLARNEAAEWLANHQREKAEEASRQAEAKTEIGETDAVKDKPSEVKPIQTQAPPAAPISSTPARIRPHGEADEVPPNLPQYPVNLAMWHKWLELYPNSESLRFNLHLGLGYGRVGAIRGFGFDLIHHRNDVEVRGTVGAFGWTRVRRTSGLAWSAGVVTAESELAGVDFGWLFAYRDASSAAHQTVAASSPANADIMGVQFGGLGAWSRGSLAGSQGSVVFAYHQGQLRGLQLSGVANVGESVQGAQVATGVNVAEDVRGVQIGLVNIARHVDGVAIGLVNISDNVRAQALTWVERDYLENLGMRYVYQPLTFGYSIGYNPISSETRLLLSLGARFSYKRFAFAPSLGGAIVGSDFVHASFGGSEANKGAPVVRGREIELRVCLEWELVPKLLTFMAGPVLAMRSDTDRTSKIVPRWFVGLTLF